jgi:hypothetical protein
VAVLPAEIPTGLVTAQFYFVNEDNIDADTDPDLTVVSGTVAFTCEAKDADGIPVPLRMPTKKAVIVPMRFDAEFDSQGRLVPVGQTNVGIEIPATNSALFNPTGFTWKVTFNLVDVATGFTVIVPSFSMSVPEGVTTDLVDAMPVSTAPGTITVQGPSNILTVGTVTTGAPGSSASATLTGASPTQVLGLTIPRGDTGLTGAGVPAGGAALQLIRKNAGNTTTEWVSPDKSLVGLGNVDNTADAAKPISTATQTALDLKAPLASPAFTGTPTGLTKTHVGLGSVDNTSDASKPVSTATQTALNLKADTATLKAQGISAKLVTDAPSGYPTGYSYFAVSNDVTWPTTYATIATLRYGAARTVQTITGKVDSDVWVRTEMDGDVWTAFKKQATTAVATAVLDGLMSAADKAKLDAATSSSGVASAIVQRASNGFFNVPDPTSGGHPASKTYTDTQVATKADTAHTHAAATGSVAGFMSAADKTTFDAATANVVGSTLAKRTSTGQIGVAAPTSNIHAATKQYVDDMVWDGSDITTGTIAPARIANATAALDGLLPMADKALIDTATYASSTGASLVRRHSTGTFQAATPTQPTDVAIKTYVDVKLTATKGSAVSNATVSADATSAATQLNALLATLRANNIIA